VVIAAIDSRHAAAPVCCQSVGLVLISGDRAQRCNDMCAGPQLLAGIYGAVAAADAMALASWAVGTPAAMSDAAMAVLEGFVLDGLGWMVAPARAAGGGGAVWDWQVVGRRVAVPYLESEWKWPPSFRLPAGCPSGGQGCMTAPMLSVGLEASAMRQLANASKQRAVEWLRFADLVAGGETARTAVGNRQYWDSDYVAHARSTYLFTVRT
jgi:hypothetical protein